MDKRVDIIEYMPNPFTKVELALSIFLAIVILFIALYILKKLVKKAPKSSKDRLLELKIVNRGDLFIFTALAQEVNSSSELRDILVKLEPYKFSKSEDKLELPTKLQDEIKRYINSVCR